MHRGFTLLELLITVVVLTVLLLFASPNFSKVSQQTKAVNLANEIHGFLIQAKSEAVLRNQDLWVHIDGLPASDGKWTLSLSTASSSSAVSGKYFFSVSTSDMRWETCQCQSFHCSSDTSGKSIFRLVSPLVLMYLSPAFIL